MATQPSCINERETDSTAAVYYFSHIPKTGGTSFTAILDRFFHADEIFSPQLWWDVGDVQQVRQQKYRFFRGHFGMGAQALSESKLHTLTILRDPLKMAYSAYRYVQRESNTKVHDYVVGQGLTFEDFLQDPRTKNLAQNRLFKSLALGAGIPLDGADLVVTAENYRSHKRQWNKAVKGMDSEEKISLAKAYLDGCFWVGFLEQFELSLMLLCQQMSWPVIGVTEKLNKHPEPPEISELAKSLVQKMNGIDYQLYNHAKRTFDQKAEVLSAEVNSHNAAQYSMADWLDENYQKNHLKQTSGVLAEAINYDFSMPLLGQNWHQREWLEIEGIYFRWTGPEAITSIDFWLSAGDYAVCIEFINVSDVKLLKQLGVAVNGHAVKVSVSNNGNVGGIMFGCKKEHCQANGLLRIQMTTGPLSSHDAVFNSGDSRKVGFAVKSITINRQELTSP